MSALHDAAVELRRIATVEHDNNELLQERLAELELALEDIQWIRLANETERELSRNGLQRIMAQSRWMFLKNPLISRGVRLQADYVWAQGSTIKAEDQKVQEFLDDFMADEGNRKVLYGAEARIAAERELQVTGNLFFVFFSDLINTGKTNLRRIPADEIQDIITNPDDRQQPRYYRRQWVNYRLSMDSGQQLQAGQTAWYPDVLWDPDDGDVDEDGNPARPATIGEWPVMWDSPVYHIKVGGLADMRFGVPETYSAMDWARADVQFLEDWVNIVKAYGRFAMALTVKGGSKSVAAAKSKLSTTLAQTTPINADTNPPAVGGATWIQAEGAKLEPIKTAGATTSAEDGREVKNMAACGLGWPVTFLGDADVGNHATAKTLDRPSELKILGRQKLWKDADVDIFRQVVKAGIAAGVLPATVDTTIDEQFPPILEHDVWETMQSIVAAAGTGRLDKESITRQICAALGITDVDAVMEALEEEEAEAEQKAKEQAKLAQMNPPAPAPGAPPQPGAPPAAQTNQQDGEAREAWLEFAQAVRGLREQLLAA